MTMSGKYFPNNWQGIHDAPDEAFEEIDFEDFMDAAMQWHIPSSHSCVMRVENRATGKIQEHAYKTTRGAQNKIVQLVEDPDNVIMICDDQTIHLLKYPDEYFDD